MSYIIYYSDPAKTSYPITVADNTIYKGVGTGGLTLVGRNYPGYGQYVAEDLIHILENSANTVPPENPIEGQLWYDSASKKLRINDGAANNTNWKPINGLYQQTTEPTDAVDGDVWVDLTRNQVFFYAQNSWTLIGPEYSGTTSSGPKVETVIDSIGTEHTVVNMYIDGSVWAVIADASFSTGDIFGFSTLQKGINVKDDSLFNGTADSANNIRQLGTKVSGNSLVRNDINQSLNGQIAITQDSNALKIGTEPTFILERTTGGSNANFVNTFESYGTFSFNIKDPTFANLRVMTVGGNPQQVRINATTQATSSTGALYVEGGANIKKDVYVGGGMYFTNANSTLTIAKLVLTASTASVSTTTGALTVAGGVGIGGALYLNGDLSIKSRVLIDGSAGAPGQILVTNGANKVYWANFNGSTGTSSTSYTNLSVTGNLNLTDYTNVSTSTSSGALTVAGGVGVGGNVNIGGFVSATSVVVNTTVSSTVISTTSIYTDVLTNIANTTQSTTSATGALVIAGGLGVGKNVNIGGRVSITDPTNATSSTNGALVIAGGVGITKDLYVSGQIVAEKLVIQYTTVTTSLIVSDDVFTITNTTQASSTVTGAFVTYGGAGIGRDVRIGGTAYVQNHRVLTTATLGGSFIDAQSIVSSTTGSISVNTATLMNLSVNAVNVLTTATGDHIGGILIGTNITIDENGRMSIPDATDTTLGIVKVTSSATGGIWNDASSIRLAPATNTTIGGIRVGAGLDVYTNGTLYVDTSTLVAKAVSITTPASTATLGAVKIGSGIDVTTSGTISVNTAGFTYVLQTATNIVLGGVRENPTNPDITLDYGTGYMYLNYSFSATSGLSVGSSWNGTINEHVVQYSLSTASVTTLGGVKIGAGIGISPDGTITVTTGSFALQTATNAILGGVKVGANLLATPDGTISFNTATLVTTATTAQFVSTTATNSQLGGIKIGTGFIASTDGTISVDPSSVYSLPTATTVVLGGVKIGTGISVTGDGTISLNTATLMTTATTARFVSTPAAAGTLGGVKIGTGISVTGDGTISLNTSTLVATAVNIATTASGTQLGAVQLSSQFTATTAGLLYLNTATVMTTAVQSLTTATASQQGNVRIGSGLSINGDAIVSLNTATLVETAVNIVTPAAVGTLGGVKIGTGIGVTLDGTISLNTSTLVRQSLYAVTATFVTTTATGSRLGGIKIGTGFNASIDGTISVDLTGVAVTTTTYAQYVTTPASPTQLGGVIIGSGISVDPDGTIALNTSTLVATAVSIATTASGTQLGAVQLSSQFTATTAGILYLNTGSTLINTAVTATYARFVTTTATNSVIGGVKIGSGISASADGTISVSTGAGYTLPTATTSSLGGITGVVGTNVALGTQAGWYAQGSESVAVGINAGQLNQAAGAVAIGAYASTSTQDLYAVSIGYFAGSQSQGDSSIAIGQGAGRFSQGYTAIAIGSQAGETNQANNSIVINASGVALNNTTVNSLVIKPIRAVASTSHFLFYNPLTGEVSTASTLANIVRVSDVTQATATATGAVQIAGGASIGGALWLGGSARIIGLTTSSGIVANAVTVTNVTQATATATGAVQIAGGASIGGNMWVGGQPIMPNRIAMRVYGTASGDYGPGGVTTLTNSQFTTDYNIGAALNTATGVFTAPVAGVYATTLTARVPNVGSGTNQIAVLKNDSNSAGNSVAFWECNTNTGATHFTVSGQTYLNVNDTLRTKILLGRVQFDANDNWTVTFLG